MMTRSLEYRTTGGPRSEGRQLNIRFAEIRSEWSDSNFHHPFETYKTISKNKPSLSISKHKMEHVKHRELSSESTIITVNWLTER
jgi:hypothetical protein